MHELDWLLYEKLPPQLQGQINPESKRGLYHQIDELMSEGVVGVEGLNYWLKAKQADFLKEAMGKSDPVFRDYAYVCAARYNSAERDPKVRGDLLDWRINRAMYFGTNNGSTNVAVANWQKLRALDSQAQKR